LPISGTGVGRYYDPATGQFVSVDPAVDRTDAPYKYVSGDPANGTDPLGLGCLFGICTHSFDPMASLDAIVNIGRGATFGLTDQIANLIVPGASCTVAQDSLDQFIGSAATTLLGGEALDALLGSGRFGDLGARLRAVDWADETGSLGSTGRTAAQDLKEQLAMEEAASDPGAGTRVPIKMTDPRWPASDGWVKMRQNVNGVEIHYVLNTVTRAVDDFKFAGGVK
jgi:uncharacterized protein RhaS with RHS repeats